MKMYNNFESLLAECGNYSNINEDNTSTSHQKLPGETVEKPKPTFIKDLLDNDTEQNPNHVTTNNILPFPLTTNHLERLADVYAIVNNIKNETFWARNNVSNNDAQKKIITRMIKKFEAIQDIIKGVADDLNHIR